MKYIFASKSLHPFFLSTHKNNAKQRKTAIKMNFMAFNTFLRMQFIILTRNLDRNFLHSSVTMNWHSILMKNKRKVCTMWFHEHSAKSSPNVILQRWRNNDILYPRKEYVLLSSIYYQNVSNILSCFRKNCWNKKKSSPFEILYFKLCCWKLFITLDKQIKE